MASRSGKSSSDSGRPWYLTRDFLVILGFFLFFTLIAGKLFATQVVDLENKADAAYEMHTSSPEIPARRGTIYDRNGETLASSIATTTITVNPKLITKPTEVAKLFEKYLGKKYKKTYDEYLELVQKSNTGYVYIQRDTDKDIADELETAVKKINTDGVDFTPSMKRVYPNEESGSQVVGTVDIDGKAIAGLEMQYDSVLSGTAGTLEQEHDVYGGPIAGGQTTGTDAQDGTDIVTSIDIKLQQKVESTLSAALKEYKAKGGSVTVMDASSGEVFATCSMSKTKSEDGKKTSYSLDSGKLWSVSDAYEPGSTFKTITTSCILEKSKVTSGTTFECPTSLTVGSAKITDSHTRDAETMSLKKIITDSSNIGMVLASRKVKTSDLYNYYSKLGFGSSSGIDFPGETQGLMQKAEEWDGVRAANVSFGQGLMVSGMQLIRAYGAVEQGGTMQTPHFLIDIPNDQEKEDELTKNFTSKKVLKENTCKSLTSMLKNVVKEGTGTDAAVDGFSVAGKTGTAEVAGDSGAYIAGEYIVSFCGWLSSSNCDLVCLVTVDKPGNGGSGGDVCGPIFADIMSFAANRYQAVPATD